MSYIRLDEIEEPIPRKCSCSEYHDNEEAAASLPHATADEAGDSFLLAVYSGWIDSNGNVLCPHNS